MAVSPIFKLAGKLASNLASRSDSGLPRIEKIFGTPPRVPFPTTAEKISRSDAAHARGPDYYIQQRMNKVTFDDPLDEVILDAPLSRPERDYFANISKSGSGFSEKKLSPTEVEFFEEMLRKGDLYEFKTVVPSAKIRTDAKGNKYLRVQGKKGIEQLYEFLEPSIESGRPLFAKGEMPSQMRDYKWYDRFKDVEEFKHGGGLSSINKPITINGQRHNLAWIRPDEASALKAMGGSGKKVDGIPAYFDAYSMGETPFPEELYSVPEPETADDVEQFIQDRERLTAKDYAHLPEAFTYKEGVAKEDQDDFWNRPSDDPTEYQKAYDRSELNSLKTKLIERLGVPGMEKYMRGLGTAGLREVIGKFHTGWDFGGDLGTAEGISRNIASDYASKLGLKEYMKRLKDLEGEELSDEKREERLAEIYSDLSKTARDTGGVFTKRKKFTGVMADFDKQAKGVGLNPLVAKILKHGMPGTGITKLIAGAGNTLADLAGVIGEYTTEAGKKFSVRKDGSLVEADMPPDPSSVDPGTVEVAETVEAVAPTPEVVVAEAGPMKAYQTGLQSIESNKGVNDSIQILMDQYGISEGEARVMLGLDVNIA